MLEREIQKQCLDYLHAIGIFCWRNNNMGVHRGEGQYSFSGMKGVSDIIGILPQSVTIEGRKETFGNILCVEVKTPKGVLSEYQKIFLEHINSRGGIGIVVHSLQELQSELTNYL